MTDFEITRVSFHPESVRQWADGNAAHSNWPVVYVLDSGAQGNIRPGDVEIYVG